MHLDTGIIKERRKHPRSVTYHNSSFILMSEPAKKGSRNKLGEIIDISMGGLAFYYTSWNDYFQKNIHLTTLFGLDELWLAEIPVKKVSDYLVQNHYRPGTPQLRRRSVKFHGLDAGQKKHLQQFIWLNTTDENTDTSSSSSSSVRPPF